MSHVSRSQVLYTRAKRVAPGGTHSNSRVREPHPHFAARARGADVWDVDGHRWTDFVMGNAAVVLGHRDPHVQERIVATLTDGLGTGMETELAVDAAERFLALVQTADQVRFTNTGTEAAMHAIHAARAATGRPAIAKAEASYHGWWDDVFVSTWPPLDRAGDPDAPQAIAGGAGLHDPVRADGTLVLPFNDAEAARALLDRHAERLAAVIVEPALIDIGFVAPEPGYLQALRDACDQHGIWLIFDELLTGFRLSLGGAQKLYGVRPDLSIWGKALANGFPIAAVAGTEQAMAWTLPGADRAPFVGTFNGYAPAMAACAATLERLEDGSVLRGIHARSDALRAAFRDLADRYGIPGSLHGEGGHVQPYFTDEPVKDYRSAARTDAALYAHWARTLGGHGVLVPGKALLHGAFSAAHGDEAFEAYLAGTDEAFASWGG